MVHLQPSGSAAICLDGVNFAVHLAENLETGEKLAVKQLRSDLWSFLMR